MRLPAATACALLACAACTTDFGAPPDAAPCTPSPDRFVTEVWPQYLATNHCADRGCHDFSDGHGTLRLRAVGAAPAPGTAIADWPLEWRENYLSAIQLLDCAAPTQSRLLTVPSGFPPPPHPPGPVVRDPVGAAALFVRWVGP